MPMRNTTKSPSISAAHRSALTCAIAVFLSADLADSDHLSGVNDRGPLRVGTRAGPVCAS
jgi:hypothetical protein